MGRDEYLDICNWGMNAWILFPLLLLVSAYNALLFPNPQPENLWCTYVCMYVCGYLLIYFLTYISTILVFPIRSALLICASEVSAGLSTLHSLIHFYRNNTVVPRGVLPFHNHSCFPWSHTFFSFHSKSNPLGSLLPHCFRRKIRLC